MTNAKHIIVALALGACGLLTSTATAQETSHFAYDVQGGFTDTVGSTGRAVNMGWNAGVGVGYNLNTHLGALLQFDFNENGINGTTLSNVGFPNGEIHVWDFSFDPIYHITPAGPIDFYVTGGGGVYHYVQQFSAPSYATVTGYDPGLGFYQSGIPTAGLVDRYSVNRPGFDIGAGFAFGRKWHTKFFAQADWQRVLFENGHYDMLPVSFGARF